MFNNIAMPIYAVVNRANKSVGRGGDKKQFKSRNVDGTVSSGTSGLTGERQRDDRRMAQKVTGESQVTTGSKGTEGTMGRSPVRESFATGKPEEKSDEYVLDEREIYKIYQQEIIRCLKKDHEKKLKNLNVLVNKYSGRLNNEFRAIYQEDTLWARQAKKAFNDLVPCTDLIALCLSKYKKEDGSFDRKSWEFLLQLLSPEKRGRLEFMPYWMNALKESLCAQLVDALLELNHDKVAQIILSSEEFVTAFQGENGLVIFDVLVKVCLHESGRSEKDIASDVATESNFQMIRDRIRNLQKKRNPEMFEMVEDVMAPLALFHRSSAP